MTQLFSALAISAEDKNSWQNYPFSRTFSASQEKHESAFLDEFVDSEGVVKALADWHLSSSGDLLGKMSIILLEVAIAEPLIILATLVEGVIRALFGGALYLSSLIPSEESDSLSKSGWALLTSALENGTICGDSLLQILKIVSGCLAIVFKWAADGSCLAIKKDVPPPVKKADSDAPDERQVCFSPEVDEELDSTPEQEAAGVGEFHDD